MGRGEERKTWSCETSVVDPGRAAECILRIVSLWSGISRCYIICVGTVVAVWKVERYRSIVRERIPDVVVYYGVEYEFGDGMWRKEETRYC